MAKQDYYELLGVSRDATDGEIKKAFRGLARELHPDVSEAPDAEERFREVAEAYEVLSDDDRRARYDRYGHEAVAGQGFHTERFMDLVVPGRPARLALRRRLRRGDGARGGRRCAGGDRHRPRRGGGRRAHRPRPRARRRTCEVCEGDGAAPGRRRADLRGVSRARARSGRSCARRSGSSCARLRAASAPAAGRSPSGPAPTAAAAAGARCGAQLGVDIPAGIDDGQAVRLTGPRARRRAGRAGRRSLRARARAPRRALRARRARPHRPARPPLLGGRARQSRGRSRRSTATSRSRSRPGCSPAP